MIEHWPDPDDIERYERAHPGLSAGDIVRDIARLVTIAELCARGFLNDDCVLTGGMALRLRGSNRFTMFDTDSSMRGRLDEVELAGKLDIETDELAVRPDDGTNWERNRQLTIAQPITYDAYFAAVGTEPVTDRFSFTINMRGLTEPATWVKLVQPYNELVFSDEILVPVMSISEQAAEKTVGRAAASVAKHYLDLAWIGRELADMIDKRDLQRLCRRKLEVNGELFPASYEKLKDLPDLLVPLARPDSYYGPLNKDRDHRARSIRFMGNRITWQEAKALVRQTIIPRLFDVAKPHA